MTSSLQPEIPPVRLPGQRELPSEDGEPMETERHVAQDAHLLTSLAYAMRARDDVYVASNMFVYFSTRQLKNEHFRGPDVFVVLGAEKKERLSWVLWEELRLPDVVIEVTSPSTIEHDYGTKKDIYERVWKTAVYAIYDPATHRLDAWELDGGRYVPAARTEEGDVIVDLLGMRLGVRNLPLGPAIPGPSLRWIDAQGIALPSYDALADRASDADARASGAEARANGAEARASDAEARANDAEARASALEAELARLRRG